MNKKLIVIIFSVLALGGLLAWLFMESSKPLPGERIADLGRGHVPIGEAVEYNSNPPTSGKHYEDWIRSGVYSEPREDRNLVHSLEHGYVILSYNCERKISDFKFQISNAYAHGREEEATDGASATTSGELPKEFKSEECHKLVDQLISIYEKKGKTRLIVVPRPNLDVRIALSAWGYLDKLSNFNEERINKFIDAHLNMGPEKTMEQ